MWAGQHLLIWYNSQLHVHTFLDFTLNLLYISSIQKYIYREIVLQVRLIINFNFQVFDNYTPDGTLIMHDLTDTWTSKVSKRTLRVALKKNRRH